MTDDLVRKVTLAWNFPFLSLFIAVACIQAEIESVTFKVTWLWRTRSPVKATTFAHILLTFLSWITLETKKNFITTFAFILLTFLSWITLETKKKFIALACIQAEIESVTLKVMWPWRTRSPVKATILAYIPLTFLSGKTLETKKNFIALACIQAEIESVTFKVTRPWRTRSPVKATILDYILLTFLSWITLETKKNFIALACIQAEIESVTFKVTWPWRTRSPVEATILAYIPLTFLSGKTLETKKNFHRSSLYTSWDRKCHFQGHVTLTYKVTRQATILAYIPLTFLKWKSIETKKNFIALACIQAEIESVTFKVTWPWRRRSPVKATILAYILLTFLRWITLKTKKNWMFQRVYLSNYYSISLFSEFQKLWRHSRSRRDVSWVTMSKIIAQYSSYATPRGIPEISLGYLFPSSSYRWLYTSGVSKDPTTLVKG